MSQHNETTATELAEEFEKAEEAHTHPLEQCKAFNAEEKDDERICIAEETQGQQAGGWLWSDASCADVLEHRGDGR